MTLYKSSPIKFTRWRHQLENGRLDRVPFGMVHGSGGPKELVYILGLIGVIKMRHAGSKVCYLQLPC